MRRQRASEAEEIIANEQPGQTIEEEGGERADGTQAQGEGAEERGPGSPQGVVLKIRRRRFRSAPQKGEVVITRRLFRTGESEYLLNGKLCRLRDIQDIFMGTGLGPESYAIIGQERIGQLLSSKPYERRSDCRRGRRSDALQDQEAAGGAAAGEREAESGARGRHF
jgi:chromosome segregation protein